jgi:hypothetical protein
VRELAGWPLWHAPAADPNPGVFSLCAGVASVYAMLAVYARAKGYASPYMEAM